MKRTFTARTWKEDEWRGARGGGEEELPPLPKVDAEGNAPAMEFARASLARKMIIERRARGWTQTELAKRARLRVETINRLEHARHTAAESAARDAESAVLQARRDADNQRLALKRAMGLSPTSELRLAGDVALRSHIDIPTYGELAEGLETRRIDLLALRRGYDSEEATLRAEVLSQFPKINLGFNRASDNTGVHSASGDAGGVQSRA
jgi:outer membrane protein TolC